MASHARGDATTGAPQANASSTLPLMPNPSFIGARNTRARRSSGATSATSPTTSTAGPASARTAGVGPEPTSRSRTGARLSISGRMSRHRRTAASSLG